MSRGLSAHQADMLRQLERLERRHAKVKDEDQFAFPWSALNYGEIAHRKSGPVFDYSQPQEFFADLRRHNWNREQTIRRALRSLERRGLVYLKRHAFSLIRVGNSIYWSSNIPEAHIRGESHIMIGVELTDTGRKLARAMRRAEKQRKKEETAAVIAGAMQAQKEWLQQRGAWPPVCSPTDLPESFEP
jgi:DNA-binding MarR family transcriptional regulator